MVGQGLLRADSDRHRARMIAVTEKGVILVLALSPFAKK
jgi:hypothetical protein